MANSFNFGDIASVQTSNNISYLKPYTINTGVTIKATEVASGTSQEGRPWKSLNITFGNDEGIYIDRMFYFDEKDPAVTERKKYPQPNGGETEAPSTWEIIRDKMAVIGLAFNPDGFKKLQSIAGKLRTCEELMTAFKKIIDAVIDKNPTNMKLIGRNQEGSVYATLPKCTGIAQATEKTAATNGHKVGEWYTWTTSPFGEHLSFSAYEEQQKNKLTAAKPTTMEEKDELGIDTTPDTAKEEFDYSSLL